MREDRDEGRVADKEEDEQQHDREHNVGDGGLEVLNAVGGEGAREQHEDGHGAELADDEVEEDDDHVVELLNELAKRRGLLFAERLHAKAQRDGEEDDGEHRGVAREGGGNVRGDDVEHNEQRVRALRAAHALKAVDGNMEHAHVIKDDAAHAGHQERKKRTDQKTLDTLERNSAKCTGIGDLSYCQCNGSKHHRHDDELKGTDEHLARQIEKAKRAARAGSGDILEQNVVDGGPHSALAGAIEVLPEEQERKACRKSRNEGDGHFRCQRFLFPYFHWLLFPFLCCAYAPCLGRICNFYEYTTLARE